MDRVCGGGAGFGNRSLFKFIIPRKAGIGFGGHLILLVTLPIVHNSLV
jgi:hypothetical protein